MSDAATPGLLGFVLVDEDRLAARPPLRGQATAEPER
jgi:hypothetical protein